MTVIKYESIHKSHYCMFVLCVVYPSGGMLEMSNGYPNSSSPLGGSPSPGPGPSPVLSNKNLQHTKQHSPGAGRTNLRVVIPTPQGHSITTDEVSCV